MPSPIAHSATGYVIYRIFRPRLNGQATRKVGPLPLVLAAAVGLSLIPDLDSVFGIFVSDLERFHNNLTHSLILGAIVALGISGVVWLKQRSGFMAWFMTSLLCYELHVVMDSFTTGRGVMYLWPFSSTRYSSPISLFYGVQWSQGWISPRHLWTIMTELGFVLLVGVMVFFLSRIRQSQKGSGD